MIAKPEYEIAYQDICNLVNKHSGAMSAAELLAVASNMIGKLIALQDQRKMTVPMAFEIVQRNIEIGNRQAMNELVNRPAEGSA